MRTLGPKGQNGSGFFWASFLPVYPRLDIGEVDNPEMLIGTDLESPK